jgi:hypothetical protein
VELRCKDQGKRTAELEEDEVAQWRWVVHSGTPLQLSARGARIRSKDLRVTS